MLWIDLLMAEAGERAEHGDGKVYKKFHIEFVWRNYGSNPLSLLINVSVLGPPLEL